MRQRVMKVSAIALLCAIASALGLQRAWSVEFFYVCKQSNCSDMAARDNQQDCGGGNTHNCLFTKAGGTVIWCDVQNDSQCATLVPVQSSPCTGTCETDPTHACTNNWTKCKLP
jgi:hypothetical protein